MSETPNFGFKTVQPGDLVFGKILNDSLESIDSKLATALYRDHMAFMGAALAVADPGIGLEAPVALTPFPAILFSENAALTKVRVVLTNNTVAAVGLVLNFLRTSGGVALLTIPIAIPAGAALDTVVVFPAGSDLDSDDGLRLMVRNPTAGGIAGAFDVLIAVSADIKYPGE